MNQSGDYENGTTYGSIYSMDVLSVHQRSQLPLPSKTMRDPKKSLKVLPLKMKTMNTEDKLNKNKYISEARMLKHHKKFFNRGM